MAQVLVLSSIRLSLVGSRPRSFARRADRKMWLSSASQAAYGGSPFFVMERSQQTAVNNEGLSSKYRIYIELDIQKKH